MNRLWLIGLETELLVGRATTRNQSTLSYSRSTCFDHEVLRTVLRMARAKRSHSSGNGEPARGFWLSLSDFPFKVSGLCQI